MRSNAIIGKRREEIKAEIERIQRTAVTPHTYATLADMLGITFWQAKEMSIELYHADPDFATYMRSRGRAKRFDHAAIVADYKAGATIAVIAQKYGTTTSTVHQVLTGAKVKRRRPLKHRKEEIDAMLKQGLKLSEVAERMGVKVKTILTLMGK